MDETRKRKRRRKSVRENQYPVTRVSARNLLRKAAGLPTKRKSSRDHRFRDRLPRDPSITVADLEFLGLFTRNTFVNSVSDIFARRRQWA